MPGMAVPDWPNTYGYNLFLYPWQTWIAGPWDLFIEHGHRLLGALVGLITIALRRRGLAQGRAAVDAVGCAGGAGVRSIFQGVLGGLRVLLDEPHGGHDPWLLRPAFFAFSVVLAAVTSSWWRQAGDVPGCVGASARLALATTAVAYVQLVLGAQLRHRDAGGDPGQFRVAVMFHLFVAGALIVHVVAPGCRRTAACHAAAAHSASLCPGPARGLAACCWARARGSSSTAGPSGSAGLPWPQALRRHQRKSACRCSSRPATWPSAR